MGSITDIKGIEVGHYTDKEARTGCTVVLCRDGAVGGVDVRGSAPGTRETDLLDPVNAMEKVQAVVLSGGSAFGLEAASGVMDWLEEKGFLEKQTDSEGKSKRVPTRNGLMIGLSTQMRQGQYGEYQAVFYNADAQRFVLDNLFEMLSEK